MKVVVVGNTGTKDAVIAAPFTDLQTPVLYTDRELLPDSIRQELNRLSPDQILVFGGPVRVAQTVIDELETIAPVTRIYGPSVYGTSVAASQTLYPVTVPPVDPTYTHTVEILDGQTVTVQSDTRYVMAPGVPRMEGAGRQHAFQTVGWVEHVMIDGIEATGYDPPTQAGVIQLASDGNTISGRDVIMQGLNVHHNDEVGIKTRIDEVVLRDSVVSYQGRLGLSMGHGADPNATGGLIEDVEISYCNWERLYSPGNEAGGTKFWQSTNLTVRRVESHSHYGPGIWADKDNIGWVVEDCHVHDILDGAAGIFQEIGGSCHIRNNLIERALEGAGSWLYGAGIVIGHSQDGIVEGNTIRDCGNGIGLLQQDRGSGAYGVHELRNNLIRNNIVEGSCEASGVVRADLAFDFVWDTNTFVGNTYPVGHRFAWENSWGDLDWWRQYHPADG